MSNLTATGACLLPTRRLIRAAHGADGVMALVRAYSAVNKAQDARFYAPETERERHSVAAYEKERALHALWRSMGYQDCPTHHIGAAIEWSF